MEFGGIEVGHGREVIVPRVREVRCTFERRPALKGLSGTTGLTLHLSDHASGNHIYTSSSEHSSPDRERAQRPSQP